MAIYDESVLQASSARSTGNPEEASARASEERRARDAGRSNQIPWGYGRDRVTAMAIDPDRLFIYWEVLDESLERARGELGDEASSSFSSLRVYDTTGRLFDGTNAHSHFDQPIQRSDRQWFCDIGKPTSSAHVELGLLTPSGRFQRVARSGRVDFPRREPAPAGSVEWMSVSPGGLGPVGPGSGNPVDDPPGHAVAGSPEAPVVGESGGAPAPTNGVTGERHSWVEQVTEIEAFTREGEMTQVIRSGEAETILHREEWVSEAIALPEARWQSAAIETAWEAGPFPYPVEVRPPSRQELAGEGRTYQVGEETRVLHGPWQVVVRGMGAHTGHRVLARWEVHRTWTRVDPSDAESPQTRHRPPGSSELYALSASEIRLRGASEAFYLGASELRLGGASELRFLGATKFRYRGASEWRLGGASEWRLGGASEWRLGGASEGRLGASEGRFPSVVAPQSLPSTASDEK